MEFYLDKIVSSFITQKIKIFFVFFISLFALASCDEETSDDLILRGDIKDLVPNYTCVVECDYETASEDGNTYVMLSPKYNADLSMWGLKVRKIDYYIDNELVSTETTSPFVYQCHSSQWYLGLHSVKANITIGGDECNDVIISSNAHFYINDNKAYSKHGDIYLEYNFVTTGDILHITPYLLEETSSEGCNINKVDYEWDGKIIQTCTEAPYSLSYKITEEVGSVHDLQVNIDYKDNSDIFLSYTFSSNFKIYGDSDYILSCCNKSSRVIFNNGQTISLVAKLFKGKNITTDYNLEIYLDDKKIGEANSFPYNLNYKLDNQSPGLHKISKKWITIDQNGEKSSQTSYEYIVIAE